jgi:putative peptidoglycan lipid II flippase
MGPSVIGVAAFQVNTVLRQAFAYTHGREIISSFNYAVRLMELPQGVVGISLATVLLTELSTLAVDKKYPEFRSTLTEGLAAVDLPDPAATGAAVDPLRTDCPTAV